MAKQINARIITKHDTESHWDKATSFKPKQGEIIVYEPEPNVSSDEYVWDSVPRIKIGDGVNLLNDLKFITEPYVKKEKNKGLSSVNFTKEYQRKIENIPDDAVYTDTKYRAGEDIGFNEEDNSFHNLGITSVYLGNDNNLYVKKRNGSGENNYTINKFNLNNINKVSITEGTTNGTIKFNGTDIKVKGLGDLAYKNLEDISIGGAVAIPEILISENYADLEGMTNNIKLRYIKSNKNLQIKIEPDTFQTLSFLEKSGGTLDGELNVNGSVTLGDTLSVTGDTTLNKALSVKEESTFNSGLTVKGVATFNNAVTLNLNSSSLTMTGINSSSVTFNVHNSNCITGDAILILKASEINQTLSSIGSAKSSWKYRITDATGSSVCHLYAKQEKDGSICSGIQGRRNIGDTAVEGNLYIRIDNSGNVYGKCSHPFYGAVYNDYAEYRSQEQYIMPGLIAYCDDNGKLKPTKQRLQKFEGVVSDTFGFAIGQTETSQTPLAVSGRVLVYCNPNEIFHSGDCVCAGLDGKASLMTRKEIEQFPDRIVGIVSEIPEYEYWGDNNIKVNGRIWIKVK